MVIARAVRIRGKGGPEVLELGEIEVRSPGPHEVAVEVAAAGLNRADCLQRRGLYPAPAGYAPDVPGLEFAGHVAALGAGAGPFRVGDRVMGITGGGGMATRIIASSRELLRVPDCLSLEEAAAVPEAFLTAHDALFTQAGVGLGDRVLLHAAGSGVGTAALQLVKAAGATAFGTSRSEEKLARLAELGLDHGVWAREGRFADALRELEPGGVDVILDTVGAAYLAQNIDSLATLGRVVTIGLLGGARGELPLGKLLAKRGRLLGSVLRARPPEEKAAATQALAAQVLPLLDAGLVRPIIDSTLPMSEVADAHRLMDANQTFGKLVLCWN